MGRLATFIKFATVLVLGGGTLGSVVAVSASQDTRAIEVEAAQPRDKFVRTTESTYETMRIYVHNSNAGNWTSAGAKTYVRAWGFETSAYVYATEWFSFRDNGKEIWLGYADIPIDCSGFQLVRVDPNNESNIWNYGPDVKNTNSEFISTKIYSLKEYGWTWSYEDINFSSIPSNFAKILMEGYETCLENKLNGYLAYNALENKFFSKMSSTVKSSTLNAEYDYSEYVHNGNSYVGLEKKTTNMTIGDKINQMGIMYEHTTNSSLTNLVIDSYELSQILVLVIAGISISVFGIAIHLKKKKVLSK